jgi:hypothetical protein
MRPGGSVACDTPWLVPLLPALLALPNDMPTRAAFPARAGYSGSGSGLFYIRGRPSSTAIGLVIAGTWLTQVLHLAALHHQRECSTGSTALIAQPS